VQWSWVGSTFDSATRRRRDPLHRSGPRASVLDHGAPLGV